MKLVVGSIMVRAKTVMGLQGELRGLGECLEGLMGDCIRGHIYHGSLRKICGPTHGDFFN